MVAQDPHCNTMVAWACGIRHHNTVRLLAVALQEKAASLGFGAANQPWHIW